MADIKKTVVVAGNYRCGTTWLAEMLCRGLGSELVFEPIRSYFPPVAAAGVTKWRPYITGANATPQKVALFRKFLDGSICKEVELHHTNNPEVLRANSVVVKFVRATMSLAWLCDTFPIRHAFLITRDPVTAVASQMRKNAGPGTPMDVAELARFRQLHPEIDLTKVPKKTDVQWLALWWAVSYHAALSTPQPHPWTIVRYEDLCASEAACDGLFEAIGQKPKPYNPRRLSVTSGSWSTGKPTAWQGALTFKQADQVREVVSHFPILAERFLG